MGSGDASWAVAMWHVLVDGVNAHVVGLLGFPLVFSSFGLLGF